MSRQPAKLPKPTAAELDLLRVIWRLGPSTVKDVHAARVRERPELTYATALRLMQVMHAKARRWCLLPSTHTSLTRSATKSSAT